MIFISKLIDKSIVRDDTMKSEFGTKSLGEVGAGEIKAKGRVSRELNQTQA